MTQTLEPTLPVVLSLCAETAADLMHANPVSIRDTATVAEAIEVLSDRGYTAAPVIDDAGYPIGVVSQSDIIVHQRRQLRQLTRSTEQTDSEIELHPESTMVREIMTPAVFSVLPDTPAANVVSQIITLNVHRLFVVDRAGILIGVITTRDLLKQLQ